MMRRINIGLSALNWAWDIACNLNLIGTVVIIRSTSSFTLVAIVYAVRHTVRALFCTKSNSVLYLELAKSCAYENTFSLNSVNQRINNSGFSFPSRTSSFVLKEHTLLVVTFGVSRHFLLSASLPQVSLLFVNSFIPWYKVLGSSAIVIDCFFWAAVYSFFLLLWNFTKRRSVLHSYCVIFQT